ncbi:MAG: DUF1552 domain-containing protein [Polyangiaceae bacterium]|jgi:hypothetical protein
MSIGVNKSRRVFLSAAGVTLVLPFLPSALWSRRAAAAPAAATTVPRRFIGWFNPNGMVMPNWTPNVVDGAQWTATQGTPLASSASATYTAANVGASSILYPLVAAGLQKKTLIITGLDHQNIAIPTPACTTDSVPGGHGSGTGCFLNMVGVNCESTDPTRTSLDQLLLPVLNAGASPLLPTGLQIGLQGDNDICDNTNCNFSRMISWSNGAAMPNLYDPQQIFLQLFGSSPTTGAPTPASTAAAAARFAQQKSVLDAVLADSNSLATKLSPRDNIMLQQYQAAVRDLETQLQAVSTATPLTCTKPTEPPAGLGPLPSTGGSHAVIPSSFVEGNMPYMLQFMALALTCDITRAITFMLGNGTSNNDYEFLMGTSTAHHGTSHHGGAPSKLAALTQIDTWEITQIATLLTSLNGVMESDGTTVLDNTTFYMSSDIGDGATHNHWDMPVLLAGGASGNMKIDGRHVNYYSPSTLALPRALTNYAGPRNPSQSTAQVHETIMQAHGLQSATFGQAGTAAEYGPSGPLTELLT